MATIDKTAAMRGAEGREAGSESRLVLRNVPWDVYEALRDEEANDHLRMTYIDGSLELMSPGQRHERYAVWFGLLLVQIACGVGFPIKSYRTTTWRKKGAGKKGKGKEADDCFYIANVPLVRHKEIDLKTEPPPDLAIEVEISTGALDALKAYAKLRVPEVWRYDGEVLRVHVLRRDGTYRIGDRSPALPFLRIDEVEHWMRRALEIDDDAQFCEEVRAWARDVLAARRRANIEGA
jgi:Uma2 family endonuclease